MDEEAQTATADTRISYLDLWPSFSREGVPFAKYYTDDVHFNACGMKLRLELEIEHLQRVLPRLADSLSIRLSSCE